MAVFDLIAPVLDLSIHAQCDAINSFYFQDETATEKQAYAWLDKNIGIFTAATQGDDAYGFFEVLPVTSDCAQRIAHDGLIEEDITPDDIVAWEEQSKAEYAYISAIAIKNIPSRLFNLSCTAALAAGLSDLFLNGYDRSRLKTIYIHTVSNEGDRFFRKFGFQKIGQGTGWKGTQALVMTPQAWSLFDHFSRRYERFTLNNAWAKTQ